MIRIKKGDRKVCEDFIAELKSRISDNDKKVDGIVAEIIDTVKKGGDKAVRDYLTAEGFGAYFGHGLGHSLGLEIHEEPRLSPSSSCEQLPVHTLVTVEPGVYLPGWGGVRIEDTVLVTEKGAEPLTRSDKQLIEIS